MAAYCSRVDLSVDAVQFWFDGVEATADDTPQIRDMEDEVTIEMFFTPVPSFYPQDIEILLLHAATPSGLDRQLYLMRARGCSLGAAPLLPRERTP
ncbi:Small ubiquitin-related modifier 3 [Amphibalanus amphitrite]|uniref:Small ubiquitin-related modifier 3 n=1 Tax=Amphibalanus amphitrite TaxID=1232801 RepID=A0A6A4X2F1_AMPAM|nr:Small ubiquitin-related modifier 3 [Amphibalanus amphitrite]